MQLKPLIELTPEELAEFVAKRRELRSATPTKVPTRPTVAAIATAWGLPKETVVKAAEAVLCSNGEAK